MLLKGIFFYKYYNYFVVLVKVYFSIFFMVFFFIYYTLFALGAN